MRDISKHACLEVKTRVSGSQIWLQKRIAKLLAGSVPVIFSSLVWSNCSETLKLNLRKLQNRAARVITGDNYDVRSKQILFKLGWKTLDERRQNLMEKYMNNIVNDNCPEIIGNLFEKRNNYDYNLRSNDKFLRLSKPNTNSMKRSFSYLELRPGINISMTNCEYCNFILIFLIVNIKQPYENQCKLIGYRV